MQDMKVVFTADELAVQKAVHDALGTRDLSNPGKMFPA